jgi:hypothetical protein
MDVTAREQVIYGRSGLTQENRHKTLTRSAADAHLAKRLSSTDRKKGSDE